MPTAPPFVLTYAVLGWSLLGISAALLWFGWRRRGKARGKVLLNVAFAAAIAGGFEIGDWVKSHSEREHKSSTYTADDPDLGYAALPNVASEVERWIDETQVYSVEYAFDEHGTRRVRPIEGALPTGSLLCFGGSFMMGEGIDEGDTLPAQLQSELGGRLRAVNFGLHGQGAHQMLARLQLGRVEEMNIPTPQAALYWAIPDHISRAAGLRYWDKQGPLYEVQEGGKAKRVGTFLDLPGHPLIKPGTTGLSTISWTWKRSRPSMAKSTPADLVRWAAIVASAKDEVSTRFPGCRFDVLLDDPDPKFGEVMEAALREHDIVPIRVSALLPGYDTDPSPWRLHKRDVHPTARATATMAAALRDVILPPK